MKKQWIALLLALTMLLSATGCQLQQRSSREAMEANARPLERKSTKSNLSKPVLKPETSDPDSEPESEPETPVDPSIWRTDPVLDKSQLPKLENGLELPLQGATAYTTVDMGLYTNIPGRSVSRKTVPANNAMESIGLSLGGAERKTGIPKTDRNRFNAQKLFTTAANVPELRLLSAYDYYDYYEDTVEPASGSEAPEPESGTALASESVPKTETGTVSEWVPASLPGGSLPYDYLPEENGSGTSPSPVPDTTPKSSGTAAGKSQSGKSKQSGSSASSFSSSDSASKEVSPLPRLNLNSSPSPSQNTKESENPEKSEDMKDKDSEKQASDVSNQNTDDDDPISNITIDAQVIIPAGTPLIVLRERGDWWQVYCNLGNNIYTGWVRHAYCMINLPDVVPSIIYDAINSYSSRFRSVGKALDGVTGKALYPGEIYNPRLNQNEIVMPVLYAAAKRICAAQQAALAEGNCLILYEAFRPCETQTQVVAAFSRLLNSNAEVRNQVNTEPWSVDWFIAPGYSNHQQGFAIDAGLARLQSVEMRRTGTHTYIRPLTYTVYTMPTAIHELSPAAAVFTEPVSGDWRDASPAPTMNDAALGLQRYCTEAGFTPLASEWWHFNDYKACALASEHPGEGNFFITDCLSESP